MKKFKITTYQGGTLAFHLITALNKNFAILKAINECLVSRSQIIKIEEI